MAEPSAAPIRCLVVDDEPVARRTVRRLLEAEEAFECVGESWGGRAVQAIEDQAPDVVFLDVQMPGMGGFEVLERVPDERLPLVVFVTAFDEYAVRAFEVRALDYLVKPFTDERFRDVAERVHDRVSRRRSAESRRRLVRLAADASASRTELETAAGSVDSGGRGGRIVIRGTGSALVIRVEEVDWMEAVGSYVRVHTGELSKLVRTSLTEFENRLDPARFCRIHRSSIVNLDHVREVEPLGHGDALVRLVDGTELRVSRSRREAFEEALEA